MTFVPPDPRRDQSQARLFDHSRTLLVPPAPVTSARAIITGKSSDSQRRRRPGLPFGSATMLRAGRADVLGLLLPPRSAHHRGGPLDVEGEWFVMGFLHVKGWLIALHGHRHRRTGARADIPEQDNPHYRALSARWQHRSDRARHRKEPAGQRRTKRHRGKQAGRECRHRHRSADAKRSGRPHPRHPFG